VVAREVEDVSERLCVVGYGYARLDACRRKCLIDTFLQLLGARPPTSTCKLKSYFPYLKQIQHSESIVSPVLSLYNTVPLT